MRVPWNASWSGEDHYEIRTCRYAGGHLAVWQPFRPKVGEPIFASPHFVRQRRSVAEYRCTVCGEKTPHGDRWTFGHGEFVEGRWATQEAPVHRLCADMALKVCPIIRKRGLKPIQWPNGAIVIAALVGGPAFEADFGLKTHGRNVVGSLKFSWDTIPPVIAEALKP